MGRRHWHSPSYQPRLMHFPLLTNTNVTILSFTIQSSTYIQDLDVIPPSFCGWRILHAKVRVWPVRSEKTAEHDITLTNPASKRTHTRRRRKRKRLRKNVHDKKTNRYKRRSIVLIE